MALGASRIVNLIGDTPLVLLSKLNTNVKNRLLLKVEGNNPGGSVKDRAALNMIIEAERRGDIRPGDRLVEATSGNTGIALAMVAAMKGYDMVLVMPENMTHERFAMMSSYGATILVVSQEAGMEGARDLAKAVAKRDGAYPLNQFDNPDNANAHYLTTGPEIWAQTEGKVTHFVASMGTTGTIMGVSRFLKEKNPDIQVIGLQPADGAKIPGIRRWPKAYLPSIYEASRVDKVIDVSQDDAEKMCAQLSSIEGISVGISSGGNVFAACGVSNAYDQGAVIVTIGCDRLDRYLSDYKNIEILKSMEDLDAR